MFFFIFLVIVNIYVKVQFSYCFLEYWQCLEVSDIYLVGVIIQVSYFDGLMVKQEYVLNSMYFLYIYY